MNRINLIYDGANHFYKSLSVYNGINEKKLFRMKEEMEDFLKVLATNFIAELNRFKPILNKVVVTLDSTSWRYEYYKEYKGNRKKDENINWENYNKLVLYFCSILHKNGVIISRAEGAEGDDLVYAWSKFFMDHGQSSVILSMDRDLTQLVNYDNGKFIVMYDNRYTKLFGHKNFFNDLDKIQSENVISDIFGITKALQDKEELSDDVRKTFNTLLKNRTTVNIVDRDYFLVKKMIVGDKGDNVFAPYTVEKNGKIYGIGDKKSDKIIESYNSTNNNITTADLYDKTALENLSETIRINMKLDKPQKEVVYKGLKTNMKLMLLDEKQIPKKVLDSMGSDINKRMNIKIDMSKFYNMNTLLKGYVRTSNNKINKLF